LTLVGLNRSATEAQVYYLERHNTDLIFEAHDDATHASLDRQSSIFQRHHLLHVEANALVVKGIGDGTLDPDEGQMLSNILEARRKVVETEKLEQRINVLEEIAGQS
jgi:hypothetical protein